MRPQSRCHHNLNSCRRQREPRPLRRRKHLRETLPGTALHLLRTDRRMNPKTDQAHIRYRRQLLTATFALPFAIPARAQTGAPQDRPIRIIVPFAAGAGTDAVARLVAPALAQSLARPVVVDNRAGASGAIGARLVAQSPPDGTTLLLVASPFTTVAAVNPKAGYDPLADFSPVGLIASGPLLWAGSAQTDARTLTDWIQRARASRFSALWFGRCRRHQPPDARTP